MLLPIHIAAGGLAIVLGAVALLVKKGGTIHRRSGLVFVYAMFVLGITAAILGNVLGGGWRYAHHPIRHAWRPAAPGASPVANVLCAVHRDRIVLLNPYTRGENPSRALHDCADARAADPVGVWRDVLLVVEGPLPP